MTRLTVGGTANDFLFVTREDRSLALPASTINLTWWTAKTGGTQITGLLLNGATVNSVPVVGGEVPRHQWPDGVTEAWADAGNGRVLFQPGVGGGYTKAEVDAQLSGLEDELRTYIAQVLSSGPTTPSGMEPPAGATLVRELTRASHWDAEVDGFLTEPSGVGPGGETVVRSTLVDGQNSNPGTGQNDIERNDMRAGDVPIGATRWMIFYMRVMQLPDTSGGGFHLFGPHEIHGNTLPQATVQPALAIASWQGTIGNLIFEANAGSDQHTFVDVGSPDIGVWHQWKLGIKYTNQTNGWCELWRDGVRVYNRTGYATTGENQPGYWKLANYRSATINGTTQYDVSGCRIYSA